MPLTPHEIRVGSLAYLDHQLLLADPEIEHANVGIDRPGPFVCIEHRDGRSTWAPLTTEHREERLFIDPRWRREGSRLWKTENQYLNDGHNTFVGPDAAFLRAGTNENLFTRYRRPYITPAGIKAIIGEVGNRNGRLL